MKRIFPLTFTLVLAACVSISNAQTVAGAPQPPSSPKTPTITTITRMVNIELVVRDSSGNPVHGLTAKDFTVKEDGKPQKLDLFEDRSQPAPADSYHSPAAAIPGRANQFSNVPATGSFQAPVNIVLLDLVDTPQLDQAYALRQLIKFCKSLPPGHQVALFLLTTRLHILQDFTGNSDDLVAAASRMEPKDETLLRSTDEKLQLDDVVANWAKAIGRNPGNFTGHLQNEIASEDNRDLAKRARIVNDAFAQIARATAGYSGRKNFLWLAEEFPIGFTASLQMDTNIPNHVPEYANVRETANLIASSQISVFPIALSGLTTDGMSAAMSGASTEGNAYGRTLQSQFNQRRALYDTISDVARETGGKAFFGTNDFAGALHEVVAQDADEYTLAYRPTNTKWDGQYRKISVQANGQHYSLSYRRGYFATPEGGLASNIAAEMGDALQVRNTLDATQLRIRADIVPPTAQEKSVTIDVTVDASDLSYTADAAGHRHAQVMVAMLAATSEAAAAPPQRSAVLNIDLDPA